MKISLPLGIESYKRQRRKGWILLGTQGITSIICADSLRTTSSSSDTTRKRFSPPENKEREH